MIGRQGLKTQMTGGAHRAILIRKVSQARVVLIGQQCTGQSLLSFTNAAMSEEQRSMGDGSSSPRTANPSRFLRQDRNPDLREPS